VDKNTHYEDENETNNASKGVEAIHILSYQSNVDSALTARVR
jgi:hypothetical protein